MSKTKEKTMSINPVVKPEWAQWQPDIFQQTLPGIPYMFPQEALPARDCANCLFHQEDWRGDGFCYMFKIEPTGNKCGQMRPIAGDSLATTPPTEGIPPEYPGDIRQASAGCWYVTNGNWNSTSFGPDHCRNPCVSGTRYCEEHQQNNRR